MASKSKIAIIGPYPPPYGGISVHIKKAVHHLKDENIVLYNEFKSDCKVVESKKFHWQVRYIVGLSFLFKNYKLIHHHSPDKYMRIWLGFMGFLGKNVYLHIHGASIEDTLKKGDVFGWLTKKLLKYVNVLPSNPEIEKLLIPYQPKSLQEIDAYLPPVFEQDVYDHFKNEVILPEHDILITTVGWFKYYNQEDLYGFDLLLESLNAIQKSNPDSKIVVVASVNGIVDSKLHDEFLQKRKTYQLEESFILLYDDYEEVWPLFVLGDIFIRATNTDGSAVSIKEAAWAQSKVIASDCVPRINELDLFTSRDANSLTQTIQANIDQHSPIQESERIERIKKEPFDYKLFREIYNIDK